MTEFFTDIGMLIFLMSLTIIMWKLAYSAITENTIKQAYKYNKWKRELKKQNIDIKEMIKEYKEFIKENKNKGTIKEIDEEIEGDTNSSISKNKREGKKK